MLPSADGADVGSRGKLATRPGGGAAGLSDGVPSSETSPRLRAFEGVENASTAVGVADGVLNESVAVGVPSGGVGATLKSPLGVATVGVPAAGAAVGCEDMGVLR
mgnify:CR=1 FL=1